MAAPLTRVGGLFFFSFFKFYIFSGNLHLVKRDIYEHTSLSLMSGCRNLSAVYIR